MSTCVAASPCDASVATTSRSSSIESASLVGAVGVGEVHADVAQARRAEQRVHHRVGQHIGVGVAVEAQLGALELHAAEDQRAGRP